MDIDIRDSGVGKDRVEVVRYEGAGNIRKMAEKGDYPGAFVHTQHGIEKILRERIAKLNQNKKASGLQRNTGIEGKNLFHVSTFELIALAHRLGAITHDEFDDLTDFNSNRNKIMHEHGNWWHLKVYEPALNKGISFMENNGMQ